MSRKKATADVPEAFVERSSGRGFQQLPAIVQAYYMGKSQHAVKVAREHLPDKREDLCDPAEWAMRYRSIQGQPFSFKYHRPLEAVYRDIHPHIAIIKGAQVGVTTMAVTRTFWNMDMGAQYFDVEKQGLNVGYLMPTLSKVHKFVKTDVDSLARESSYLGNFFDNAIVNRNSLKQFLHSNLHLYGMQNDASLKSWQADAIILDEFDEMAEDKIELVRKRMNASELRHEIDLSTPTIPDFGIHKMYRQSDQQVWHIQCPNCKNWTDLDFFRDWRGQLPDRPNTDPVYYADWREWTEEQIRSATWGCYCPKCLFKLKQNSHGEWRAMNPNPNGRDPLIRGYEIPVLAFPLVNYMAICLALTSGDAIKIAETHRSNLGKPYLHGNAKLQPNHITDLSQHPGLMPDKSLNPDFRISHVTMGVDVGTVMHYRVSATVETMGRVVVEVGRAANWTDLDEIIKRWRVSRCVVDQAPEYNSCREFQKRFPHIVVRAAYSVEPKSPRYSEVNADGLITIQRTVAHEDVYSTIIGKAETWVGKAIQHSETILHMCAPYRTTRINSRTGETVSDWDRGGVPDHLFHASIYDRCALALMPSGVASTTVHVGGSSKAGWGAGNQAPKPPTDTTTIPVSHTRRPRRA